MNDLKDLVSTVTTILDNADAVSDCETPAQLAAVFFSLYIACQAKTGAISTRYSGDIAHAMKREQASSEALAYARRGMLQHVAFRA